MEARKNIEAGSGLNVEWRRADYDAERAQSEMGREKARKTEKR